MTAQDPELSAALGWPGGISDPALDRKVLLQMVATLRLASQQALEALDGLYLPGELGRVNAAIAALRGALAQQAEQDLSRCPQCNGPADNGFDRSFPPSPYLCTKCMAEPVEPVAWLQPKTVDGYSRPDLGYETCSKADYGAFPVCHAPPQRTMVPLTEEEILAAVGWERAAMYMKLTPNFPVDEAKQETLKNARTVERAVWEKNHG